MKGSDELTLTVGGSAPEGPGDHSPRLQPWVSGDHLLEVLKGATQLSLQTSDHPLGPTARPTPERDGQKSLVSPFQGSSRSVTLTTAEAMGYDLWPLRGSSGRRATRLEWQGLRLENVDTPRARHAVPLHSIRSR